MSCSDIFLGLVAVIFPPVAVWIKRGLCSADSFINILLCVLGYIPGLIHAWYIIAKYPEYDYEVIPDAEQGQQRVTYYVISNENGQRSQGQSQRQYGTQAPAAPKNSKPARVEPANNTVGSSSRPQQQQPGDTIPPPSYADVVAGDHKVQRQD